MKNYVIHSFGLLKCYLNKAALYGFAPILLLITISADIGAQGGANTTGNGGRNTIQGRIYFQSGRRADTTGTKVRLESFTSGDLTVFADTNGAFAFKNLSAGSYSIVVEAGDYYEIMRESIYIDDPGTSNTRGASISGSGSGGRTINIPIYLQLKRSNNGDEKSGILNAQLAGVPQSAIELYEKAVIAGRSGDSNKAIENLKQAVAIYPNFSLAFNELGVQYLKLNKLNEAIEAFRLSIKASADNFAPRLNLGITLTQKNKYEEAEIELREALKVNDASWQARMFLGISQIKLRKYDVAEQELMRAVSLGGGETGKLHYYLGGIYWRKKEYKLAADSLEKYLKLTPTASDTEAVQKTVKELRNKQNGQ